MGRERWTLQKGEEKVPLAIRTTRVFKRVAESWKQVHHHGSIDDSVLLKKYQSAVLNSQQTIGYKHIGEREVRKAGGHPTEEEAS